MLETMMVSSGSVMYVMAGSRDTWGAGKDRKPDDLVQIDKSGWKYAEKYA